MFTYTIADQHGTADTAAEVITALQTALEAAADGIPCQWAITTPAGLTHRGGATLTHAYSPAVFIDSILLDLQFSLINDQPVS